MSKLNDYPSTELAAALYDRLCYEACCAGHSGDEILTFARDESVRLVRQEARKQLKELRCQMAGDERAYRADGRLMIDGRLIGHDGRESDLTPQRIGPHIPSFD